MTLNVKQQYNSDNSNMFIQKGKGTQLRDENILCCLLNSARKLKNRAILYSFKGEIVTVHSLATKR